MRNSISRYFLSLLLLVSSLAAELPKEEPLIVQKIRADLPVGWECTFASGAETKKVPHGLAKPVFSVVLKNPSVSFLKFANTPRGPVYQNPVIPLYCYEITAKAEVLEIVEREKIFSWDVPVYFGETNDFLVITSPAYVNGGSFTLEARRALHPMWKILRKIIPNKDSPAIEEMASEK